MEGLLEVLQRISEIEIEIQGHSDNEGSRARNLQLSEARAQAVADYLINAGIDPVRLEARGYGPDNPIAPNDTFEGRALNRRVELKVQLRQP
jgi:OOP family OmpA-OmpF porin